VRSAVGISGHAEPQPIRRGETTRLKITVKNNRPDGALACGCRPTCRGS
jgi:hypothetical protein